MKKLVLKTAPTVESREEDFSVASVSPAKKLRAARSGKRKVFRYSKARRPCCRLYRVEIVFVTDPIKDVFALLAQ